VRSSSAQRRKIGSWANTSLRASEPISSRTSVRKLKHSNWLGDSREKRLLDIDRQCSLANIGLHEMILWPGSLATSAPRKYSDVSDLTGRYMGHGPQDYWSLGPEADPRVGSRPY